MNDYLINKVREHAITNYDEGGWDIVVECYGDDELAEIIGDARTAKAAIAKVAKRIEPLASYRDEVAATGEW